MPGTTAGTLERDSALSLAATYRRTVAASEERVWENVRDWEHLPWLHDRTFGDVECWEVGEWGWRGALKLRGGAEAGSMELLVDGAQGRYVSRILTGPSAGSEIWTRVMPRAAHETEVEVEFWIEPHPDIALEEQGRGYVALYTMLWDEDEAMMRRRQRELDRRVAPAEPVESLELGEVAEVRARAPFTVDFGRETFRIIEIGGELIVHATVCPHLLGPLDGEIDAQGRVMCPWHGYAFDVRKGESCDGRGLRLASAPVLEVDSKSQRLRLVAKRD